MRSRRHRCGPLHPCGAAGAGQEGGRPQLGHLPSKGPSARAGAGLIVQIGHGPDATLEGITIRER
jgi:hypothetical protein